jgi:hypothetical protein
VHHVFRAGGDADTKARTRAKDWLTRFMPTPLRSAASAHVTDPTGKRPFAK